MTQATNKKQIETPGKKVIRNYVFNLIYQVFLVIVPLVLTPYVSRVLLPEGVGQYSFSFSIITYFTLFASLGFTMYGQKEIAKYQGNVEKQTIIFWEINLVRFISTIICLIANFIAVGLDFYGKYSLLLLILSINIFACAFDIVFLFQGNEQFGKIVIRNVIVKLFGIIFVFLFVKDSNDVWIYTLINALIIFISNISLWLYLPKMLTRIKFKELKPFRHIKPTLALFIPTIVTSIYTVLDKTLIGLIIGDDAQNGYYEGAEKVIKMSLTFITCLGSVMIARNSKEIVDGNTDIVKNNVYFSIKFVWFLGCPLMFGLMAISENLNLWFFGEGYEAVIDLMICFSPIILFLGLNNVLGIQYLIPAGKETQYTLSVLIGALFNFILNIILLYTVGTIGAVLSSVLAELVILIYQIIYLKREFSVKKMLFSGIDNLIAGLIMFVCLYCIAKYFSSSIINTIILIIIGAAIYFVLIFIFKDRLVWTYIHKFIQKIKRGDKNEKNNKEINTF